MPTSPTPHAVRIYTTAGWQDLVGSGSANPWTEYAANAATYTISGLDGDVADTYEIVVEGDVANTGAAAANYTMAINGLTTNQYSEIGGYYRDTAAGPTAEMFRQD